MCLWLKAQDGSVPPVVINGVSIPSDFPDFSPSIISETAPGQIYITNREGTPYLLIYENDGSPVYYQRLKDKSVDFRVQANGMLTRWIEEDVKGYVVMNKHFQDIDTLRAQNGFETDNHELQLLENGHALLIANEERNMTLIDPEGDSGTTVLGNHIQELDENGNVVFQWLCWDYFRLEDSYKVTEGASLVDYVHMNSIAVDYDGHLVVSSRHLSECTKINRESGEIIWRLGGENNQFAFINDGEQISFQHDIRPVPGQANHYTIFDNGVKKDPPYSRAVQFYLDTIAWTAEKVWEYRADPDRFAYWMGNAQRLPNGNTVISWGVPELPKITEVTPGGIIVYEADFTPEMRNYRTYRFAYDAYMLAPYLLAEPYPDRVRLIFNKFGDYSTKYYNIYAGEDPGQMVWIDSTSNSWIDLPDLDESSFIYLQVTAVDSSGLESPASNQEQVYVRNNLPGDNLIINGDFTDGENFWTLQNHRDGSSEGSIVDSVYIINIENAGTSASDIQLFQDNIPLIHGKEYIMELDVKADAPRTVNIELERAGKPLTNYSKIGSTYITNEFSHIKHLFTMEEQNDLKARFVISAGGSATDFEIKNVSLREHIISRAMQRNHLAWDLHFYPNPVNDKLYISFYLKTRSVVRLELYNLNGELIESVCQGKLFSGLHEVFVDTEKLSAGSYLLRLTDGVDTHSGLVVVQH